MNEKELREEVKHLRKLVWVGSKEIHRLVDIWTATQLRIDTLQRKLKRVKK